MVIEKEFTACTQELAGLKARLSSDASDDSFDSEELEQMLDSEDEDDDLDEILVEMIHDLEGQNYWRDGSVLDGDMVVETDKQQAADGVREVLICFNALDKHAYLAVGWNMDHGCDVLGQQIQYWQILKKVNLVNYWKTIRRVDDIPGDSYQ